MSPETILVPPLWRRLIEAARALIAVCCFTAELIGPKRSLSWIFLLALFVVYAALALFSKNLLEERYHLARLVLDAIFFLISAAGAAGDIFWLTAAFAAYLLIEAALLHEWREVAIVAGVSLGFFHAVRPARHEFLSAVVLLGGVAAGVLATYKKILLERLAILSRQSVLFRSEAEGAKAAERQRIAADFHDGPLQAFIGFQMRLEIVRKMLERDPAAAMEELRQLQELSKTQVGELRSFIRSMRPVEVEGASLAGSIRHAVEDFRKHSGISTTLASADSLGQADPNAGTEILQIVREALHNTQKHSRASRVAVEVSRRGSTLEILVEDDGTGFPFAGSFTLEELDVLNLGPASIRRRLRGLNGEMVLESRPGMGAGLRMRIPV